MIKNWRSASGFTLIELLVVVAVIALISTFALPKLFSAANTSKQAKAAKELQTIQAALERHYLDLGYYPHKLGALVDRGYLRQGTTFRSPVNGDWYFYAVDDSDKNSRAMAYILGQPGNPSGNPHELHRSGDLPKGKNPEHRAWNWLFYDQSGLDGLRLYLPDDVTDMLNPPPTLADYRTSCQPTSVVPCDLLAN